MRSLFLALLLKENIVMIIKFKKSKLYGNLILGMVWFGIGLINFFEDGNSRWSHLVYLILGLLYIGHFFIDINYQYLKIENGIIKKNKLYGLRSKINLNEINSIKKTKTNYTLITDTQKMRIHTKLIEENSLRELTTLLEQLNLPSDNIPFVQV